jgi:hypothetical protein
MGVLREEGVSELGAGVEPGPARPVRTVSWGLTPRKV